MNPVEVTLNDGIATVMLNRPKANALNRAMTEALLETFARLGDAEQVQAAVLTGQGNIFSAGLDLVELFNYDEEEFSRFLQSLHRAIVKMLEFPKPLAAAINGHAPAGGCVLAMCCDYRVMAEGEFHIGLNEAAVGVVMPKALVELANYAVGRPKAEHMLLNASLMTAKEAVAFGLVDDYAPQGEVLLWAETRLRKWMGYHTDAWRGIKRETHANILKTLDMTVNEGYGSMIREWWSADCRAAVAKTIEQFKNR